MLPILFPANSRMLNLNSHTIPMLDKDFDPFDLETSDIYVSDEENSLRPDALHPDE